MPVWPFRVFATTVVPAEIACATRECPLQFLVFDRELDKLATAFVSEVIDVLRERLIDKAYRKRSISDDQRRQ
jgi:hypothetical protein